MSFVVRGTFLVRCSSAIVLLILLLGVNARAQFTTTPTDGSTPLGLSPGAPAGSFALSGFDVVNPYNGNLNFSLPLLGVSGRGSARMGVMLKIEAKSWQVKHVETINQYTGQPLDTYYPTPNSWSPIATGYGPGVLLVGNQATTCFNAPEPLLAGCRL